MQPWPLQSAYMNSCPFSLSDTKQSRRMLTWETSLLPCPNGLRLHVLADAWTARTAEINGNSSTNPIVQAKGILCRPVERPTPSLLTSYTYDLGHNGGNAPVSYVLVTAVMEDHEDSEEAADGQDVRSRGWRAGFSMLSASNISIEEAH